MKGAGLIAGGLLTALAVGYGSLTVYLLLRIRPVPITILPRSKPVARVGRVPAHLNRRHDEPVAA